MDDLGEPSWLRRLWRFKGLNALTHREEVRQDTEPCRIKHWVNLCWEDVEEDIVLVEKHPSHRGVRSGLAPRSARRFALGANEDL